MGKMQVIKVAGLAGALMVLAACGPRGPLVARAAAPAVAVSTAVIAPQFGDANPHDWTGRRPESYPVHGIDLSRYQGEVDWPVAHAAGVNFAFVKATEGGDRVDPAFRRNWAGAGAAGVARGAYHFFYFCTPAEDQARLFIETVPRARGALPPVLDLEWNHLSPSCRERPAPAVVRAQARIFLDRIERHYGQRPVIYTTPDFWETNAIGAMGEEVWLRAVADHPSVRYPGVRWTFWQYSGTGLVPGIAGRTDLNVFAGTPASWRAWLAARSIP